MQLWSRTSSTGRVTSSEVQQPTPDSSHTRLQWDPLPTLTSAEVSSSPTDGSELQLTAPSAVHQPTPVSLLEHKTVSMEASPIQPTASSTMRITVQQPFEMMFRLSEPKTQFHSLELLHQLHWDQSSLLEDAREHQDGWELFVDYKVKVMTDIILINQPGTNKPPRRSCCWASMARCWCHHQRRLPITSFSHSSTPHLRHNCLHIVTSQRGHVHGRFRWSSRSRRNRYWCSLMGCSMRPWLTWYVRSYQQLPWLVHETYRRLNFRLIPKSDIDTSKTIKQTSIHLKIDYFR